MYHALFVDQPNEDGSVVENFTLSERLTVMSEMNDILWDNRAPMIEDVATYWSYIMRGLYDFDALSRKLAIGIIQSNLSKFQSDEI